MTKWLAVVWYYTLKKQRLVLIIIAILTGSIVSRSMKGLPFWIPMLGAPFIDTNNDTSNTLLYDWLFVNSLFLYVSIDSQWLIWRGFFMHLRLKGIRPFTVYAVAFLMNVLIPLSLIFIVLLISSIVSVTRGDISLYQFDRLHFVYMLLLWVLGATFSGWLALLIALLTNNIYYGYMMTCVLLIVSVLTYPFFLWLPGSQWIYGAHFIHGGPTYIVSVLYLSILVLAEFIIGYKIALGYSIM
ncbi:MAG: hypothetical protein OWR52_14010 [Acidibacillus sp.]|nr:hypothetical protein [Acidibacillus sp.]